MLLVLKGAQDLYLRVSYIFAVVKSQQTQCHLAFFSQSGIQNKTVNANLEKYLAEITSFGRV